MFAAFDVYLLPPTASKFAEDYDQLFWYITAVITVAGGLVYASIVYFCFAYSRPHGHVTDPVRTPRILGSTKVEIAWTLVPLFFFLSFFVWGVKLFNDQIQTPPDAPEYFVAGKQWMWKVQHPDGQREINEMHIPVDRVMRITGTSEDVIHDFGIPAFRSKFDVVPGRYVTAWYNPSKVGTYHIFCDQYCGMGHSQMVGKVHVLNQADYEAWKEGTYKVTPRPGSKLADGSPAWEGRKLFLKLQCNACHNPGTDQRAPQLWGFYGGSRPVQGGGHQKFDDEYVKQSIRNPMAKVADGWKPIMPAFGVNQVDEIELRNLVAFIKSMRTADDLPSRTEQAPAPEGASTMPTGGTEGEGKK